MDMATYGGSAKTLESGSLESRRKETRLFANHCEPVPISRKMLCATRSLIIRTAGEEKEGKVSAASLHVPEPLHKHFMLSIAHVDTAAPFRPSLRG